MKPKDVKIDQHVTSLDGCKWHIVGTIGLDAVWGWPPVAVTSYNITMSGPCGTHKFVGMVGPAGDGGNGPTVYNGNLTNLETGNQIPISEFQQFWEIITEINNTNQNE